jgi:hypothetical protein
MLSNLNHENLLAVAAGLPDAALLDTVKDLAARSRSTTVTLLAHLGELDRRRLYLGEGCGSLFTYCVEVLRFSEAAACNRIKAARASRSFPVVLEMLADGRVNLTTIRLLAPHLMADNHLALLAEVTGMTRREVDQVVARLSPQPDVASRIRKLPARGAADLTPSRGEAVAALAAAGEAAPIAHMAAAPVPPASIVPPRRAVVAALAPSRYKLEVTLDEDGHGDLRWLQDAMRREIPDGDPAAIVRRALHALRDEIEKRTFSATAQAREPKASKHGSRDIPAHVERAVWQRDQGQCAFEGARQRCPERTYLEYHHLTPWVVGGAPSVENIALRCRAHNAYEATRYFGPIKAAMDEGRNSFRSEYRNDSRSAGPG